MKRFLLAATALTAMTAVASAADLPRRYAAPAPAPLAYAAPAFTWTGFYVGANAGGAVGGDITTSDAFGSDRVSIGGFNVGGTVGYNYQFHPNFVVGVEGDIGYADIQSRTRSTFAGFSTENKVGLDGYLGTIRGRIGYATGQWLFFGTGGWAFAEARATSSFGGPFIGGVTTTSREVQGYVVGGGVEYAVNQNISLKGEYQYIDFEKVRAGTLNTNIDTHLLKVGVNYRFSAF